MCDRSYIKKGRWRGQWTPNLIDTHLLGAGADSRNINKLDHVTEANTFAATLTEKIPDDEKDQTAGFCFHDRSLKTGCVTGFRYKNQVGLSPDTEVSSYLRTYQVVYIMKCW